MATALRSVTIQEAERDMRERVQVEGRLVDGDDVSSVSASATRILRTLAPPLLAALFVLLLIQLPLAYGLARRLQRGHEERERLLARAIEASDAERRRIAGDLHDGVVQDLAGVPSGSPRIAAKATDEDARVLNASIERLRKASATCGRCGGDPPAAARACWRCAVCSPPSSRSASRAAAASAPRRPAR